jgi:hypothetical protein
MNQRVILEFVVPTMLAIALGVVLSIGAVYLTDRYMGSPISRKRNTQSSATTDWPNCQALTGGFRCLAGEIAARHSTL